MNLNEMLIELFLLVMCLSMAITSGIRSEFKSEQFRLLCEWVMYILSFGTVNLVFCRGALNGLGIQPRTSIGLLGILFAPFLHRDWTHLVGNTTLFFILGWFILLGGTSNFYFVTVFAVLASGFGVWLFGRPGFHCGASGVVFGYIGFLLLSGYFLRDSLSIILSTLVGFCYGRLLWRVFPVEKGMSWEAHLFGFLGGVLAASYLDALKTLFSVEWH